ncbi:MAG: citrulline utilization hydrolase CtlX, partial [Flavobacteriales bacterium]
MTDSDTPRHQSADLLLMIRPASFRMNEETAVNNAYQTAAEDGMDAVATAQAEFDGLVRALRDHGITVCVQEDDPDADTPDALFPNNWVSFHSDGRVGLYPMFAVNRRRERREDVLMRLSTDHGCVLEEIVDFTEFEAHDVFLEGTGSLILDRLNRVAYASLGPRTDEQATHHFCEAFGYDLVAFTASQTAGDTTAPIYHTNVMLAIGSEWAVVCDEIIRDEDERHAVLQALADSGRTVVRITGEQVNGFAGNVLEVRNARGERFIAMSSAAHSAFTPEQRETLSGLATLVHAP